MKMMKSEKMTTAELLAAWDAGKPVWTIEMGGLGPGYEQAIQVAAFEVLRGLVAGDGFGLQRDADLTDEQRKHVDGIAYTANDKFNLGLSGSQAGAAKSLAFAFYLRGQEETLGLVEQDRRIQASNRWIGAPLPTPLPA